MKIFKALACAAAVVVLAGSGAVAATAASPAPTPAHPTVTAMRAQLRAGQMSAAHGVIDYCKVHKLRCQAQALTTSRTSKTLLITGKPIGYGARELEKAYGVSKAGSSTATIAIIDAGAYPNLESDLTIYRDTYGLSRCLTRTGCLRMVNYKGGLSYEPAKPNSFASFVEEEVSVETALDMQMASAACPKCKLLEVQVPAMDAAPASQHAEDVAANDFAIATKTAIRLGAKAVSISYGYDADHYMDKGAPAAGLHDQGTAIVSSSGDYGFLGGIGQWPQNLPTVISAGGTSLYPAAGARGYSEVAWNQAGSGCSFDLPRANGQYRTVGDLCDGHRAASDVSAVADPFTGVAVYDSYAPATGMPAGFLIVGGTSVSSPLLAGLYARAGVKSSVLGPNRLYAAKQSTFHDVTIGMNTVPGGCQAEGFSGRLCTSGPGWDGPTGRGTPNGLAPFRS